MTNLIDLWQFDMRLTTTVDNCVTTTVSQWMCHNLLCHNYCVTTIVSRPLCHNHCVMITVSWPLCDHNVTATVWRPLCDDHCVTTTVAWPLCELLDDYCNYIEFTTLSSQCLQEQTTTTKMMGLWACTADVQAKKTIEYLTSYSYKKRNKFNKWKYDILT